MKNFFTLHLDAFGFSASMICALHCLALPLLVTLSTWSGLQMLTEPSVEFVMLTASAVLALLSIVPSYFRHHRSIKAILLVLAGFVLISLGRLNILPISETLFTSAGAALVAMAHYANWKLCSRPDKQTKTKS